MNSPLGIRTRISTICRGCELEISGTLLTVDLRIMNMSEFDVILRMDWLTVYRVVIDYRLYAGRHSCGILEGQE